MKLIKLITNMSVAKKFSVSISYPPLESTKGSPFLSQNRQFQWTNTNNVIYPVIPAYAATLLQKNNLKVFWDDAIAERLTYKQWLSRIIKNKPNLIAIETKTPIIKKHWQIINDIKKYLPQSYVALMGDHVTALPEESKKNSKADFILKGGNYDFLLLNLTSQLLKQKRGESVENLDSLPIIDRKLTRWNLYAYNNSNFRYKPGAYIMSGRDCWWGKCTFCSWTTLFPDSHFRLFSPQHQIKEIKNLVENFQVKEIFDDSGTLPIGTWLAQFANLMSNSGLNKKVKLGTNMRFNGPTETDFKNMQKANVKFLLFGLESANQSTLDKLNKNLKVEQINETLNLSKKYQIDNHLTVMIGYPWETLINTQKTLNLAKQFFKTGLADSIQATILIPYPGTPLFDYCKKNNLLLSKDWDDYDMRQPIMKSPLSFQTQQQLINSFFKAAWEPQFLLRKTLSIRSFEDIKFLSNYAIKFLKKLHDFS